MNTGLFAKCSGFCLALSLTGISVAEQIQLPFEFSAGTPASAEQVNANLNTLTIESNQQDARLNTLENRLPNINFMEVTPEVTASVTAGFGQGIWGLNDVRELIPADTGICMLTQNATTEATSPEHDTVLPRDPLHHSCSVYQENGMWRVRATLTRAWHQYSELSTTCSARCLRWR